MIIEYKTFSSKYVVCICITLPVYDLSQISSTLTIDYLTETLKTQIENPANMTDIFI